MGQIEYQYQKHRINSQWRISETDCCIFHIESELSEDPALDAIIHGADERNDSILEAIGINATSTKAIETNRKINWWLYGESVLIQAGMKPVLSTGSVDTAGIHYAVLGCPWSSVSEETLIHEEIHHVWGQRFGEAPSLLNEGVAEYYQRAVSPNATERFSEFCRAWREMAEKGAGFLPSLMTHEGFWRAKRDGMPTYQVGGAVVRYIIERFSAEKLQQIFLESHYDDPNLADRITDHLGIDLPCIEREIAAHCLA